MGQAACCTRPTAKGVAFQQVTDEAAYDDAEEVEFDIPEDAYGATILAIVRDFQEVYNGQDVALNLTTGLFSLLVGVTNLVLQFSIIAFIDQYVVRDKIGNVQSRYRDYHERVFDASGNFMLDQWEDYDRDDKVNLCQIGMTNPGFYIITLFLWWTEIMKEFRTSWKLFRDISIVPRCEVGSDMIRSVYDGDCGDGSDSNRVASRLYVVALTKWIRVTLYLLVCTPKILICLMLLWLGCQWLSATNAFEELIMNAVAMAFVTHIDDILYEVFIPAKYKEEVSAINFLVQCPGGNLKAVRNREIFEGYRRSAIYVSIICVGIFLYSQYFQNVLPPNMSHLKEHCHVFIHEREQPCTMIFWERLAASVTDGSASRRCYPYGPQAKHHA